MFVVKRSPSNPLLSPYADHSFESLATFNGSFVRKIKGKENEFYLIYRAEGSGPFLNNEGPKELSTIGIAHSLDPLNFIERKQFIFPEYIWEKYGCEDPRVTFFEGYYYIFYTALGNFPFSAKGIRVAVAKSKDLKKINEKHLVTPFNAKAMAMFPERVNGKIALMLSAHTDKPPATFSFAYFDNEKDLWNEKKWMEFEKEIEYYSFDLRRSPNDQIEAGAPPILTPLGWLLIYSHIEHYGTDHPIFGIQAVLTDKDNPHKILGRTVGPIIVPEEVYEKNGRVKNITFPSSAELLGDTLHIYYGGADTVCAKAEVSFTDLVNSMIPKERDSFAKRYEKNPILLPPKTKTEKNAWEMKAVFNPAAIKLKGKIYIPYRSMSEDNTSYIGLAISENGYDITERLQDPIYSPRADFESKKISNGNSGCEDARIVEIDDRLYITYTAYNGIDVPRVAISSIATKDFLSRNWNWSEPVLATIANIDDKDSSIVPEKLENGYLFLHRINGVICGAYVPDLDFKERVVNTCIEIMKPREGLWDGKRIGISGPPIKTEKGWLLFYHGISEKGFYRVGAALLDLKDPTKVISRTTDFILEPEEDYELHGQVENVVFPCGQAIIDDTIFLYYGGADSVVGVATISFKKLLEILK